MKTSLTDKTGMLILYRVVNKGVAFLGTLLIVRMFTQEVYGTFRQLTLTGDLFLTLFVLALPSSLLYFIPAARNEDERREIASQIMYAHFALGVLGFVFILLGKEIISGFFHSSDPRFTYYLILYGLTIGFNISSNYFDLLFFALEKVSTVIIRGLVLNSVKLVAICFVFVSSGSLEEYLVILGVLQGGYFLSISWVSMRAIGGISRGISMDMLWKQVKYSLPMGISGLLNTLSQKFDLMLISFFFSPSVYAIYTVGASELPILAMIRQSASNLSIPHLTRLYQEGKINELLSLFHEMTRKTALIIVPVFVYLLFMARDFIVTLYTERYVESTPIFQIYLFILPLSCAFYGSVIRAVGKTKPILNISLCYVGIGMFLNYFFLKLFGIIGPPIANVLALGIFNGIWIRHLSRILKISPRRIYPIKSVSAILFFSVVALIPLVPLVFLIKSSIILLGVTGLCYLAGCFWIFKFFNVFKKEDLKTLQKWGSVLTRGWTGLFRYS